jgi:hypothetical protein
MVNTLRVASLLAVIVAGLVLASVTGFVSWKSLDAGNDEELSRILSAPSVVDKFRESQGDKTQDGLDAASPLVKEADAFALYLNPPAPVVEVASRQNSARIPRPGPVAPPSSAKFNLLGTCYSAASQSECFAYIRMQDGKTSRWVRVGDVIGRTQIKEIRRDSIICSDGNSETPMSVPQRQDTSSLIEVKPGAVAAGNPVRPPSPAERITGPSVAESVAPSAPITGQAKTPLLPPTTDTERAALGRLVDQLRETAGESEEKKAAMSRIMEEFRAVRRQAAELGNVEGSGNEPNISPIQGRSGLRRRLGVTR